MESVQLSEFFRSIDSWPSSEGELDMVAERLAHLTGAPFAAIVANSAGSTSEKIGLWPRGGQIVPDAVSEYLKKQAMQSQAGPGQLKLVQLSPETNPLRALDPPVHHLALTLLTSDPRKQNASRGAQPSAVRLDCADVGWLALATPKALNGRDELIFVAVAQRLIDLLERVRLESMVQLRNQFLSIASHELKTPLTSIYGMLQLQERMLRTKKETFDSTQRDKLHTFFKMVIRQVERLNELIDGLLDVSRIQNGRFMVEPVDTDVATLARDAVSARLSMIASEAGVRLELDAPNTLMAWVDPVRFEEVVTNLVMNAIRFSPEGGCVWIRLREDGGSFRLSVRDQGPNVPIEDHERIFQPFERAARTSRLGGLGLGLFISRQIAQLHGGNVSLIESVPGKGNVFEANFPIRGGISLASA